VNGAAKNRTRKRQQTGKAMWLAVTYLQQIMLVDFQDPVRQCYEWQNDNI